MAKKASKLAFAQPNAVVMRTTTVFKGQTEPETRYTNFYYAPNRAGGYSAAAFSVDPETGALNGLERDETFENLAQAQRAIHLWIDCLSARGGRLVFPFYSDEAVKWVDIEDVRLSRDEKALLQEALKAGVKPHLVVQAICEVGAFEFPLDIRRRNSMGRYARTVALTLKRRPDAYTPGYDKNVVAQVVKAASGLA